MDRFEQVEQIAEAVARRWFRRVPQPRWGRVTSADPLEVELAGDETSTPVSLRSGGYTPQVDDRVWLVQVGTGLMVVDEIVRTT